MKSEENSKTNLNDLIQKIKSEGIEEAERKSEEIIKEARLAASEILNKARSRCRIHYRRGRGKHKEEGEYQ